MRTPLKHPRRPDWAPGGRSSRSRVAALGAGVVLALLLVVTLAAAISGSGPFGGDDSANSASNDLPPGWVSLEPLLPLAPGLKEMSALRQSASGGASRVLGARDSSEGALRLRVLPSAGPTAGARRLVAAEAPAPARPARTLLGGVGSGLPSVDRVIDARRLLGGAPGLGDLETIINRELGELPGGTVPDIDVRIPPIDPLPDGVVIPPIEPLPGTGTPPVGNPLPGTPPNGGVPLPGGGSLPGSGSGGVDPLPVGGAVPGPAEGINVTIGDLRADTSFDVLLASSGTRVLERYVFADRDIAGLSAQINLRSRVLAAEALSDRPLARVVAASLSTGDTEDQPTTAVQSGSSDGPGSRGDGSDGGGADKAALSSSAGSSAARVGGGPRGGGRRSSRGSAGGGGASSPDSSSSGSPRNARGGSSSRTTQPSRGRSRPRRVSRGGSARGSRPRGGARRSRGNRPSRGSRPSRGNRPSRGKASRARGGGRASRDSGGGGRGRGGDDKGDDDD